MALTVAFVIASRHPEILQYAAPLLESPAASAPRGAKAKRPRRAPKPNGSVDYSDRCRERRDDADKRLLEAMRDGRLDQRLGGGDRQVGNEDGLRPTVRHRLNRGDDRAADSALHVIAIGRLRTDQRTTDYVARRIAEGHSKLDAIRALKRYLARGVFVLITQRRREINATQIAA